MNWKAFYTRALNYLDALEIETNEADDHCKGWKQLKLMFEGDDRKALQSLIDSGTITESMKTTQLALDAIRTTIKAEEHIWAFWDELLSDVRQLPGQGMHALSMHICNLISQCKFPMPKSRRCSELWFCNMQCNLMSPETGSANRTSPSSHTSPFSPSGSCLNADVSSIKRPRRRDELTLHP